jgi:hypothetical protein
MNELDESPDAPSVSRMFEEFMEALKQSIVPKPDAAELQMFPRLAKEYFKWAKCWETTHNCGGEVRNGMVCERGAEEIFGENTEIETRIRARKSN